MSSDRELVGSAGDDVAVGDGWIKAAIAVPLLALLIPLAGVAGGVGAGGVFFGTAGAVLAVLVLAGVAKGLMAVRHGHRMEELRLQIELARHETARLAEVNRVVYHEVDGR